MYRFCGSHNGLPDKRASADAVDLLFDGLATFLRASK